MRYPPRPLFVLALLALLLTLRGGSEVTAQAPIVLKVASGEAPGSPTAAMLEAFAAHAVDVSGAQIEVRLFNGGALGSEAHTLERVRAGTLQACIVSLEALAAQVPAAAVLLAPHVFRNQATADRRMDGPVEDALRSELADHDLVFGAWGPSELRGWASAGEPIVGRNAGKGLVHHAPRSVAERRTAEALGATLAEQGLGMLEALGEVQLAALTPLELIASGLDRGTRSYTVSDHALQGSVLVYSRQWFDGLPEEAKTGLATLPPTLTGDARKALRALRPRMLEALRARGVTVQEPAGKQRRAQARSLSGIAGAMAKELGAPAQRMLRATRAR